MDIRAEFLKFFEKKGHKVYASMPLVPDDPTLLFTNAGMVQFKDIFTGKVPRPTPPIATSSQLCIRAGGKHNDLENVGYTARHHTLFEMLGNFSFGEYFKETAIAHAWEFVTDVLKFPREKLWVTIHESDDEAFEIWTRHIAPERIKRMGDKDNFWQMGDTGPCGPCSEIFIDQGAEHFSGPEDYFGGDGDRFLEIWNLVFMQYERSLVDGKIIQKPLPKPSIDTGMGLERVVALKEGKFSNFDSSLFMPYIELVAKLCGKPYKYESGASYRVIADHARSVAFLLAQGVNFDKEGRGYVLRRILRRAVRHGYLLGLREAFLYKVAEAVCEQMGGAYPYLLERKEALLKQCKAEEERFLATIDAGMELFATESAKLAPGAVFSGAVAFKLYDTYGFPLDLTQDMLREKNAAVDVGEFEACMDAQKARAKAHWKGSGDALKEGDFKALLDEFGASFESEPQFVGYENSKFASEILALLDENLKRVESLGAGERGFVLLDKTPFYPESGGPVGDKGELFSVDSCGTDSKKTKLAAVLDTKKYFGLNLSAVETLSALKVGTKVLSVVSVERAEITKHHTATHLLHLALRSILGGHIAQAGSLVTPSRLRFDFSHGAALSDEELEKIQAFVNARICDASPQNCEHMDIESAKKSGAVALFGEKYGANVRVITFGDSRELCGGIHVPNTAHIGSFYILRESGVSAGVRRIEAVVGKAAVEYALGLRKELEEARAALKTNDLLGAISKLKTQVAESAKRLKAASESIKGLDFESVGEAKLVISHLSGVSADEAKAHIDRAKEQHPRVAAMILLSDEESGKIAVFAGVKGVALKANLWAKEVAAALGGNGGGRDDFATAGGKDFSKIGEALELARKVALAELK